MPPVRTSNGRASKACEACRARKTRCYESAASRACLRCTTLRVPCSLEDTQTPSPLQTEPTYNNAIVDQNYASCVDRILRLENTVQCLSSSVAKLQESRSEILVDPSISGQNDFREKRQDFAPLAVIQDAEHDAVQTSRPSDPESLHLLDVVTKGVITRDQADSLLSIFWSHYGRWIGVDESQDSPMDFNRISPLLLCACCLIAVRHSDLESASTTASALFLEVKALLGESLMETHHSIEFFQALLVLSLWSTTLGQKLLSVDAWLLSGFALQHAAASDVFRARPSETSGGPNDSFYRRSVSVYNHLCLAHLHSCVTMRRKSMVSQADLSRARAVLESDSANNFEVRMVAEMNLYFIIYQQCLVNDIDLPRAKQALQAWKVEWAFLFDQPRRQFLQTSFFFAGLLIYENSLSSKSAAVRESVVADMVRLASDILNLFMDTADERTIHLTDHVFHIVTFAAVTLCRLSCRYESQLRPRIDLTEIGHLVSRTVRWLQELDASPHISQLMSRLISNVQTKLRPKELEGDVFQQTETEALETFAEADVFTTAPDFLGMEDYFQFEWDAIIPDWQSLQSPDFGNDILSPL